MNRWTAADLWMIRTSQHEERWGMNGQWFAARFHLDQMLKLDPGNAEYRRPRGHPDAEWKKANPGH
jgi:hypothetical protein